MPGAGGKLPLFNAFPALRNWSRYIHLSLFDWVDKLYTPGMKAYSAVWVGAFCPVLEVSFDGAANMGELAAYLVMTPGV